MRAAIAALVGLVCLCSLPAAAAVPSVAPLVLADFEDASPARFPAHWQTRDRTSADLVYSVTNENGERFLHAVADANSVQIGLRVDVHLSERPLLSWRWRARELPTGSDERESATNDSVAGVYVVFKGSFGGLVPRALKYVWSARVPRGTTFGSPRFPNTQIVVLESGADADGAWRTETVNVKDDYRRLFQADAPDPQGIAILTDADNTGTRSVADYDDFRALAATSVEAVTPDLARRKH